jgi:ABC-2 type transport system ATP-binding protein
MVMGTPEELERSVSGRKTVIQLEKASDAILAALRKLPLGNMVIDGNRLTINVTDPEKENSTIVDAIVRAGGHVQSVTVVGSTLEDAYLRLVRQAK